LGTKLIDRKRFFNNVGTVVRQIALNAFNYMKTLEIEPQLLLIGGIPSIGFTLKGKSLNVSKIFQMLTDDIQWS